MRPPAFVLVGEPESNRTAGFAAAVRAAGGDLEVIRWRQVLADDRAWRKKWRRRIVKLDTPGRDGVADFTFTIRGSGKACAEGLPELTQSRINEYYSSRGRLVPSRYWFLGWSAALERLAALGDEDDVRFVNAPGDIATMFDKVACHARLAVAGVPVPAALPPPRSCDDLLVSMRERRMPRVFLKPAHGSGGGGVVAFETQGARWRATTALDWELSGSGPPKLYTTSRLRTETDPAVLRPLIDELCRGRLHVEAWMPKAGLDGRTFDVRVIVVGGHAAPPVLRLAQGPLTNLHLGAEKGSALALERRAGPECVARLREVAEQTMREFPHSLCAGIDLAVSPDFRRVTVLEVNAFGDLLENFTWQGADAYTWEVRALLGRDWPPPAG